MPAPTVLPRLFPLPTQSFFLFGPRGTGKSTWLRQELPEATVVDLLEPTAYRELSARPERLREIAATVESGWLVIDEVQRAPELLHVVHALIEERRELRFALTGSSARKLRRGGVDLLAGRALNRSLHPFMAAELPGFELATALRRGLVPLVVTAPEPEPTLAGYATLYLEQEIQAEGLVRNVGAFARFLEAISFSHGGVLNVASVARECEVERKTVAGYLEILEDLLLAYRVPLFTRRARRRLAGHPKLYLFDAGIFRSLRPRGRLDRPEEIEGAALEGLVAQHLRAQLDYSGSDAKLFCWRTERGAEVDFVVYGAEVFCAIEVKNTSRVRPEDLRSLRAFRDDYPEATTLLLYRGERRLVVDGIACRPVADFLLALRPARTWSRILELGAAE